MSGGVIYGKAGAQTCAGVCARKRTAQGARGVHPLHSTISLYRLDGSRDLLPSWHTCTLRNHMKSLWKIRFVRHSGLYILTMSAKVLKVEREKHPQGRPSSCPQAARLTDTFG